MALFADIRKAKLIFGEAATAYGTIVNEIAPFIGREQYRFEDPEVFERNSADPRFGPTYINRTYWYETLERAHLAAVASILRTCRWVDLAVREYEAENIFGWASAARSIIEAAGDAGDSLGVVPRTLANNRGRIEACLAGKSSVLFTSAELEDALIHFSHARKISKGEIAPDSHRAKSSAAYVGFVADLKVGDVRSLYAHLCEIVHPAALSVAVIFNNKGGAFVVDPEMERDLLKRDVEGSREVLGGALMAALNPALLTLRVLHSFDLFTKINPLRKVDFSPIPAWPSIEKALRQ